MQAIFETVFAIFYLSTVITLGIIMVRRSAKNSVPWLFGIMALVLGFGDMFHLIPRCFALISGDMANYASALGIGKLITSITMTVFYVILYYIWRKRYNVEGKKWLSAVVLSLAVVKIAISLMPQNAWTLLDSPYIWGIYRNIPFTIMGIIIIILFFIWAKQNGDKPFKNLWLAVTLSFAFYAPVVLFAAQYPIVGALMVPKTLAYVWIVLMGYNLMKSELSEK